MKQNPHAVGVTTWIAMPRPNARPLPPTRGYIFRRKGESVPFREWVEYDDGDISNQEFPERYYSDDHGKTGVSTEEAKEDQYQESIIGAIRAAKAGELWENHLIKIPLSKDYTMEIVLTGENHEKVDIVDRARKKGDGPVIGGFESMRETQHAIAMVMKTGKFKRMKWLVIPDVGMT